MWSSTGNLHSPNRQHRDIVRMLRWEGVDLRVNTARWSLPRKLSEEQKVQIKAQLEEHIKAAFSHKAPPLPIVSFPSGQQHDHRMVDIYHSPQGEVGLQELQSAMAGFKILDGQTIDSMLGTGSVLERNEQLLRFKDICAEHLKDFIKNRKVVIRNTLPVDTQARIKDLWALDGADGLFTGQVDVLIELPREVDAVAAAHDWPGWFFWKAKGKRLELAYRNRFLYCCWCKDKRGIQRHLRVHCTEAPSLRCKQRGHAFKHCPQRQEQATQFDAEEFV